MKVFDYLHQELSLAANKLVPRYELWTAMALQDAHPMFELTSEKAAQFLAQGTGKFLEKLREQVGAKEWGRLVKRVHQFNPDIDTPEEVMKRLCDGTSKE